MRDGWEGPCSKIKGHDRVLSDTTAIGPHEQSLHALGVAQNRRSTPEYIVRAVAVVFAILTSFRALINRVYCCTSRLVLLG